MLDERERERERERREKRDDKSSIKKNEYEYLNKMKCRLNDWYECFVKVVV